MTVTLLGSLLLAVSLVSVVIYMSALGQILVSPRLPGLLRTAVCRLFAALLYVGVGLLTLQTNETGPLVGLGVFTVVQLIWQGNAIADIRLSRRRKVEQVPEHSKDNGITEPVPNYAPKLSDAVVSAEIDRLSARVSDLGQDSKELRSDFEAAQRVRRFGFSLLAFVAIIAVLGLVFGLFVYNRAARSDSQSRINAQAIAEIEATQARLESTITEFCGLYDLFIGSYNSRSRASSVDGPEAYDENFRRLVRSAERLRCGVAPPSDLPR